MTLRPLCPNCYEVDCECKGTERRATSVLPARSPAGWGESAVETGLKNGAGRGPTGKLRNFKAMSDEKLATVYRQLRADEVYDPEALDKAAAEVAARFPLA